MPDARRWERGDCGPVRTVVQRRARTQESAISVPLLTQVLTVAHPIAVQAGQGAGTWAVAGPHAAFLCFCANPCRARLARFQQALPRIEANTATVFGALART